MDAFSNSSVFISLRVGFQMFDSSNLLLCFHVDGR